MIDDRPMLTNSIPINVPAIVDQEGAPFIALAIFDSSRGPILVNSTNEISDIQFPLYLFPSQWSESSTFLTTYQNYYIFGICVVSPLITHARGSLNATIAIVSTLPYFGKKHLDFLKESEAIFRTQEEINFDSFVVLHDKYQLCQTSLISHPLEPFVSQGNACKVFFNHPELVLTLWRARMLGYKILLANTNRVGIASDLSYFVAALSIPFKKITDSAFHIELVDSDKFENGNWLVASVTHPQMQNINVAPITLVADNNLKIAPHLKWIQNGRGKIMEQVTSRLRQNDDSFLLSLFIEVNSALLSLVESNYVLCQEDLTRIGLDQSNNRFFFSWLNVAGLSNQFEPKTSCCCCCC